MNLPPSATRPKSALFRLGHRPDPWAWPSWAFAKPDGTFDNRWDDPQGIYRVLYASTQRLGTFIECLARFRPDPAVVAGLADIDDEGDDDSALPPGHLPLSWLEARQLGEATVAGDFAAVGTSESLGWLRNALAGRLVHYRIPDLDAAAIRATVPRRFTQEMSRVVYEISIDGERRFAGISYRSRLGDEFENWAIFEPAEITPARPAAVLSRTDPDFLEAIAGLGLTVVNR